MSNNTNSKKSSTLIKPNKLFEVKSIMDNICRKDDVHIWWTCTGREEEIFFDDTIVDNYKNIDISDKEAMKAYAYVHFTENEIVQLNKFVEDSPDIHLDINEIELPIKIIERKNERGDIDYIIPAPPGYYGDLWPYTHRFFLNKFNDGNNLAFEVTGIFDLDRCPPTSSAFRHDIATGIEFLKNALKELRIKDKFDSDALSEIVKRAADDGLAVQKYRDKETRKAYKDGYLERTKLLGKIVEWDNDYDSIGHFAGNWTPTKKKKKEDFDDYF